MNKQKRLLGKQTERGEYFSENEKMNRAGNWPGSINIRGFIFITFLKVKMCRFSNFTRNIKPVIIVRKSLAFRQ